MILNVWMIEIYQVVKHHKKQIEAKKKKKKNMIIVINESAAIVICFNGLTISISSIIVEIIILHMLSFKTEEK